MLAKQIPAGRRGPITRPGGEMGQAQDLEFRPGPGVLGTAAVQNIQERLDALGIGADHFLGLAGLAARPFKLG